MELMKRVILAVPPGQVTAAGAWGQPLAHLCYRVGEGPHLFRAKSPVTPQGGMMVIDDSHFSGSGGGDGFCNEVLRECAARRFSGVVCRFQDKPQRALLTAAARLGELCQSRGLECYLSEGYGSAVPTAKVIIPTALSGGSLQSRLEEAQNRYGPDRVAIWVERSAEDFLLPSPSGSGAPLTMEELERRKAEHDSSVFFSAELCAHYFTYMAGEQGHFVLFDDAGSIRKKLLMARQLGITTAFLPYETTADLLENLLREP